MGGEASIHSWSLDSLRTFPSKIVEPLSSLALRLHKITLPIDESILVRAWNDNINKLVPNHTVTSRIRIWRIACALGSVPSGLYRQEWAWRYVNVWLLEWWWLWLFRLSHAKIRAACPTHIEGLFSKTKRHVRYISFVFNLRRGTRRILFWSWIWSLNNKYYS